MAYLEKLRGAKPGRYSEDLLAVDEQSGPWLAKTQQSSPIDEKRYPRFDVDANEGVIWFGDEERNGLVASLHAIGSYSPEDQAFVWAWTNEKLAPLSVHAKQIADDHPEIDEFEVSLIEADELKSWTLAGAVAFLMKADACYRLPGEVQLFVALTDLTEIPPDDPRANRLRRDDETAAQALAAFAGQGALRIGAAVAEELEQESPSFDPLIDVLYRYCERLEAMNVSPVGAGTPAAATATEIAARVRQATLGLSLPPGHPERPAAARKLLDILEQIAKEQGAWPG